MPEIAEAERGRLQMKKSEREGRKILKGRRRCLPPCRNPSRRRTKGRETGKSPRERKRLQYDPVSHSD